MGDLAWWVAMIIALTVIMILSVIGAVTVIEWIRGYFSASIESVGISIWNQRITSIYLLRQ